MSLTDAALVVDLVDGRSIIVPLTWYPRLAYGSPAEREHWRLIGDGEGITGRISMRTSASKGFLPGDTRVRHRPRCDAGSKAERPCRLIRRTVWIDDVRIGPIQ